MEDKNKTTWDEVWKRHQDYTEMIDRQMKKEKRKRKLEDKKDDKENRRKKLKQTTLHDFKGFLRTHNPSQPRPQPRPEKKEDN